MSIKDKQVSDWQSLPVIKEARILNLSDPNDDANSALTKGPLPAGAEIVAEGYRMEDFGKLEELKEKGVNVIFVSHPNAREPLEILLGKDVLGDQIEWVHARSAGIDFLTSQGLADSTAICTNAKGQFSSTLAEYTMTACSYFAKDLPSKSNFTDSIEDFITAGRFDNNIKKCNRTDLIKIIITSYNTAVS